MFGFHILQGAKSESATSSRKTLKTPSAAPSSSTNSISPNGACECVTKT